jgi:hypothetical protein
MRYRDQNGQRWADVIDFHDDVPGCSAAGGAVLGEIDARG